MNKYRVNPVGLAVVLLSMAGMLPTMAWSIDNAQSVFVTPAYRSQMQTVDFMNKLDANGDHKVSREEFDNYYNKLFDALDRNHDGQLDAKEWVGAAHNKEVISLSSGGYARALGSMKMMQAMDTGGNHTVSRNQFLTAQRAIFDKMDVGHTGTVDAAHWLAKDFPH
jgi:Ca2+-binding EF-hand superfamily protein